MVHRPPAGAVRAAAAVSRSLHRLADAPMPAEIRVLKMINAAVDSEVVLAMVRLGVPDALRLRPLSLTELAERTDSDSQGLLRLLRVAESLDLVRRRDDRYGLTSLGEVLVTDRPASMAPFAAYFGFDSTRRAWAMLTEAVRGNRPVFADANGATVWDWFAAHPDEMTTFATTMRTVAEFNGADLAESYPWEPGSVICDLGGGIGTMLSFHLATDPTLRGVVLDSPDVLEEAVGYLAASGLSDRVELRPGSFFDPFEITANVFTMKDVLHDWDDESCRQILRNVRSTMRPEDRLVLFEIPQDPHTAHLLAPFVDLTMLCHTDGGRQRTLAEFDELFAATGLRRGSVTETPLHAAIEAVPTG